MDKEGEEKLIGYLVEKVTKGVRKQLKGYVSQTQDEINWSVKRVEYFTREFHDLVNRTALVRKDWEAVDLMLRESRHHKKLLLEMRQLHCDIKDKFTDINLLEIEIKNYMKFFMKKD